MSRLPKQALFLHVQKTAGTSIMEMARELYGIAGVVSHADFMDLGRDGCNQYPFVSGHFGYDFAEPLLKDRYAFTFLRDPMERLISLYWFSRSAPEDNILYNSAKQYSFDEFLQLGRRITGEEPHPLRPQLWNNQTYQLAHGYGSDVEIDDCDPKALLARAMLNLRKFDFIGFTESFESDSRKIFRNLARFRRLTKYQSNITVDRPRASELPNTTIALLREMTNLDRELYRHARATQWSRRIGAFWRGKRATTLAHP